MSRVFVKAMLVGVVILLVLFLSLAWAGADFKFLGLIAILGIVLFVWNKFRGGVDTYET